MKTNKTLIHVFRKSRPHHWLLAQNRKRKKAVICVSTPQFAGVKLEDLTHSIGVGLVVVLLSLCACSSHHYFSINAEEITNPEIVYSDSTHLTNPF